jgi:hypothetical protein
VPSASEARSSEAFGSMARKGRRGCHDKRQLAPQAFKLPLSRDLLANPSGSHPQNHEPGPPAEQETLHRKRGGVRGPKTAHPPVDTRWRDPAQPGAAGNARDPPPQARGGARPEDGAPPGRQAAEGPPHHHGKPGKPGKRGGVHPGRVCPTAQGVANGQAVEGTLRQEDSPYHLATSHTQKTSDGEPEAGAAPSSPANTFSVLP